MDSEEHQHIPDMYVSYIRSLGGLVNIVGGCCGTTPEHIKQIKNISRKMSLRSVPMSKPQPFVVVGERTNVHGSKEFKEYLDKKDLRKASVVAIEQVDEGASVIDINVDSSSLVSSAPVMRDVIKEFNDNFMLLDSSYMLDSTDWNVIVEGLKATPNKPIVNSISLQKRRTTIHRKGY